VGKRNDSVHRGDDSTDGNGTKIVLVMTCAIQKDELLVLGAVEENGNECNIVYYVDNSTYEHNAAEKPDPQPTMAVDHAAKETMLLDNNIQEDQ